MNTRYVCLFWNSLQYTLSQTTVEQLKEPIFNIWHWEPNEVIRLGKYRPIKPVVIQGMEEAVWFISTERCFFTLEP